MSTLSNVNKTYDDFIQNTLKKYMLIYSDLTDEFYEDEKNALLNILKDESNQKLIETIKSNYIYFNSFISQESLYPYYISTDSEIEHYNYNYEKTQDDPPEELDKLRGQISQAINLSIDIFLAIIVAMKTNKKFDILEQNNFTIDDVDYLLEHKYFIATTYSSTGEFIHLKNHSSINIDDGFAVIGVFKDYKNNWVSGADGHRLSLLMKDN